MTIAISEGRPGRPKGSRGNGKTPEEKIKRAKRNFAVEQTEIDIAAQRAQLTVLHNIQRRKEEQQKRVDALYTKQEERRAPQFQIDQTPTLWLLIALGAIMFIATAILTADGTIGASAAARFITPEFGYLLFGAIEVAILVFMLVYYVEGSRIGYDGKPPKATRWFVGMIAASGVAVALSVYHVIDLYSFDWLNIEMWVGVAIRITITVFFVLVSKALASVLFAKAIQADD